MDLPNLLNFLSQINSITLLKIPILLLLFIYAVFLFIIIYRIKAFNRIVHIASSQASVTLQMLAIIQFFLAISLFFLTLVIV